MSSLATKGKKAVKVVYSGPSDKDNVDEQVNILDEELSRYPAALAISIADAQSMRSAVRSSRLEWDTNCNI